MLIMSTLLFALLVLIVNVTSSHYYDWKITSQPVPADEANKICGEGWADYHRSTQKLATIRSDEQHQASVELCQVNFIHLLNKHKT